MNLKRDTEAPNYIIDLCCEQLRADGSLLTAIQRVLLALGSRCKTYGERESIAHTHRDTYTWLHETRVSSRAIVRVARGMAYANTHTSF